MYKIMSNHHTFREDHYHDGISLEPTILVQEDPNDSMVDVNESYMTANGDSTQYFSILDSHSETILNDMDHVDFEEPIADEAVMEEDCTVADEGNGVVLYRVDDSEELYGVQVLRDESGNLRKYQFKVRQTEEGVLEALPDTLQILPLEGDEANIIPDSQEMPNFPQEDELIEDEAVSHAFIKQEQNLDSILSEPEDFPEDHLFEDSNKDTKEGILGPTVVKSHLFEHTSGSDIDLHPNGSLEPSPYFKDTISNEGLESMEQESEGMCPVKVEALPRVPAHIYEETAEFLQPHASEEEEQEENFEEMHESYDELLAKESHLEENGESAVSELVNTTNMESFLNDIEEDNEESDDYETVDGDHVTGDGEPIAEEGFIDDQIRKSLSYQKNSGKRKVIQNIFKRIKVKSSETESPTGHFYYLIRDPEKENLVTYSANMLPVIRTNPRSILKTSLPMVEPKKSAEDLERYDKRFAKSKEAQQARQFHNFIAQTKIIHAPVRQERLPRKQTIKPMERTDEEIVVQEMFVSSNGFVETSEDGVLKERVLLQPTEFIQLSDTDEEVEKKRRRKRKSKKKSLIAITISDSDDEMSDRQEEQKRKENDVKEPPAKRPRGRPPKAVERSPDTTETSDSEPEEIIILRVDNKCPKCPKSFPSEGSLRTHMQYHAYKDDYTETKYICEKCGEQFKNTALLNRHARAHVTKTHICIVCKKVFSDQSQLISHRRSHVKEQMFKNTILQKDSPKKTNIHFTKPIKCDDCEKIFLDQTEWSMHLKSQHKKFHCDSCESIFPSKITFDHHLQKSCLKSPKKRLKMKIVPPIQKELPGVRASTSGMTKMIKCDSCSLTFSTYTSLFKHKVSKHALDTPSELSLRTRKFSGIPVNDNLRKATLRLREKLSK